METIIFVWRWEINEKKHQIDLNGGKIILIKQQNNKEDTIKIINEVLKKEGMDVYLFLHSSGNESGFGAFENNDRDRFLNVREIEIASTASNTKIDALREAISDYIKNKNNFDYLKILFNKFLTNLTKIKPVEMLKKSFLNTWLPLSIDLQGLSEVEKQEGKDNEEYFNEIREELRATNGDETDYYKKLKSFPDKNESVIWDDVE